MHQVAEQRQVRGIVDERLGVPLDAAQVRAVDRLDRLDDAVRRVRDGAQAAAEQVDGLVVEAC